LNQALKEAETGQKLGEEENSGGLSAERKGGTSGETPKEKEKPRTLKGFRRDRGPGHDGASDGFEATNVPFGRQKTGRPGFVTQEGGGPRSTCQISLLICKGKGKKKGQKGRVRR